MQVLKDDDKVYLVFLLKLWTSLIKYVLITQIILQMTLLLMPFLSRAQTRHKNYGRSLRKLFVLQAAIYLCLHEPRILIPHNKRRASVLQFSCAKTAGAN